MKPIFTLLLVLTAFQHLLPAQGFANFDRVAYEEATHYGQLLLYHDPASEELVLLFHYDEVEAPLIAGTDKQAPILQIMDLQGNLIWQDYGFGGECEDPYGSSLGNYYGPFLYRCGEIRINAAGLSNGVYLATMKLQYYSVFQKTFIRTSNPN